MRVLHTIHIHMLMVASSWIAATVTLGQSDRSNVTMNWRDWVVWPPPAGKTGEVSCSRTQQLRYMKQGTHQLQHELLLPLQILKKYDDLCSLSSMQTQPEPE